uniref:Putative secreted protein n=1 Tax=Anopheles triannulatus TaxID=58253 RepID=A0A2M4B4B1_9DIPT
MVPARPYLTCVHVIHLDLSLALALTRFLCKLFLSPPVVSLRVRSHDIFARDHSVMTPAIIIFIIRSLRSCEQSEYAASPPTRTHYGLTRHSELPTRR